MIWQPRIGQWVEVNYKDKTMPYQRYTGNILAVATGKGPKIALVKLRWMLKKTYAVIPRGNLNAIQDGHQHNKSQVNPTCHRPAQED